MCAVNKGEENLALAKLRFLEAAESWQPLGFVRRKPLVSVGGAFMLGLGFSMFRRGAKAAMPLLPLVMDLADLATRLGFLGQTGPKSAARESTTKDRTSEETTGKGLRKLLRRPRHH